jgi:hypothetical protein
VLCLLQLASQSCSLALHHTSLIEKPIELRLGIPGRERDLLSVQTTALFWPCHKAGATITSPTRDEPVWTLCRRPDNPSFGRIAGDPWHFSSMIKSSATKQQQQLCQPRQQHQQPTLLHALHLPLSMTKVDQLRLRMNCSKRLSARNACLTISAIRSVVILTTNDNILTRQNRGTRASAGTNGHINIRQSMHRRNLAPHRWCLATYSTSSI